MEISTKSRSDDEDEDEDEDLDIDAELEQEESAKDDIKKLEDQVRLYKLGGDKLEQLLSDADFRAECESRVCVLAFLPHILDSGADERNKMLQALSQVRMRSAAEKVPVGFMWLQGGDQYEIEEKLSLAFGWPAVIAIHLKKQKFGVHRGTFDKDSLQTFIRALMVGKVPLHPLPAGLGKFPKNDPWDGKDGQLPQEDEEL